MRVAARRLVVRWVPRPLGRPYAAARDWLLGTWRRREALGIAVQGLVRTLHLLGWDELYKYIISTNTTLVNNGTLEFD